VKLSKSEVLKKIPKHYLNETFSCEFPQYKKLKNGNIIVEHCKKCMPCDLQKRKIKLFFKTKKSKLLLNKIPDIDNLSFNKLIKDYSHYLAWFKKILFNKTLIFYYFLLSLQNKK